MDGVSKAAKRGVSRFGEYAHSAAVALVWGGRCVALRSMGWDFDGVRDAVGGLVNRIQREGIVGDEVSLEVARFLVTFSKISDEAL